MLFGPNHQFKYCFLSVPYFVQHLEQLLHVLSGGHGVFHAVISLFFARRGFAF